MKNTLLKYFSIICIIMIAIFLTPTKSNAETTSSGGYTIKNYTVNMTVKENNELDITEEIKVNFSTSKHGIFRKIPLRNEINRVDGTQAKTLAKIYDINVNKEFTTYNESGNKVIKIGDPDSTVKGEQTYVIKYKYNLGKDTLDNADELYYNIIGNDWDTTIDKVNFNIKMPKEFDKSKLGFSTGKRGATITNNVDFSVDGTNIIGNTITSLKAGEGLTVRMELPEGYYVGATSNIDTYSIVVMILTGAFVVYSFIAWAKYGKDDIVVETVEFYPPEGYNSAEIGFLYRGSVDLKAKMSLLIYLADKGYLKIEETKEKGILVNKKGFKIHKLKEYEGNNEAERVFFDGLFSEGSSVVDDSKYMKTVRDTDLKNSFYRTIEKLGPIINGKNKNKVFEKKASGKQVMVILFIIAVIIMIFIPIFAENYAYPAMYGVGIIGVIILIFFAIIMPKRTKLGNDLLGKVKGFKRFLETAEKQQLEELVEKNPEYFYNILPYTYALGVSNKWVKQFETIAVQPPDWYDSPDVFDMYVFGHFMNSTMHDMSNVMTSVPESSGGSGGFSGGGFSGGGFGGGGGGSW